MSKTPPPIRNTVFWTWSAGQCRMLGVPLLRAGELVGVDCAGSPQGRTYSERQVKTISSFADQAVIAMENARLLGELTRREQELSVTFEHMGDGVVMFDGELHVAAWNRNFQDLLDIPDSFVATRPSLDDYVRLLVERGEVGHANPEEEVVRYRGRASEQWSNRAHPA